MKIFNLLVPLIFLTIPISCYSQYTQHIEYQDEKIFISLKAGSGIFASDFYGGIGLGYDFFRKDKWQFSIGFNYVVELSKVFRSNFIPKDPINNFSEINIFREHTFSQRAYVPFRITFFYSKKLKFYTKIGYSVGYLLHERDKFIYQHTEISYDNNLPEENIKKDVHPEYIKELDYFIRRGPAQESLSPGERILHEIYLAPLGIRFKKSRLEIVGRAIAITGGQLNYVGIKYGYYIL